jgi:cobalamin synthase
VGYVFLVVGLAQVVATVVALVDCSRRPAPSFEAAGKLDKQKWTLILVAALVLPLLVGFFLLPAIAATIVYFVDVKPAVSEAGSGGYWGS